MGVPEKGKPTSPGWRLKTKGQGEGAKGGQRERSRPESGAGDQRGRPDPAGEAREGARGLRGGQRSSGLAQLEPSRGPGSQYLDKRLHLQVEFDNLLVTDPDVDILGSRHVGDAGYGQRRWPSSNAFPCRPALPQRPLEAGEGGGAEARTLLRTCGEFGLAFSCGPKETQNGEGEKRGHQEHFHGGLSPSPAEEPF